MVDGIYEAAQRSNDTPCTGWDFRPVAKPAIRWGFWIRTVATLAILIGCVVLMLIGAATVAGVAS